MRHFFTAGVSFSELVPQYSGEVPPRTFVLMSTSLYPFPTPFVPPLLILKA